MTHRIHEQLPPEQPVVSSLQSVVTKKYVSAVLIVLVGTMTVGSLQAAVIMTDPTFSSPVNNQRELTSFERNNGGVAYAPVAIATTTYNDTNLGWNGGDTSIVGKPANGIEALNDVYVTTNIFGLLDDVDFSLNTTVNDGDGQIFYLVEHMGNDTVTIQPRNAGGVITGWSLTLAPAHYAAITTTAEYDWKDQGNALAGTTFTLLDFTGGTGTLTGVTGLRIDGGNLIDPAQLGVAAVPEPASISLVALTLFVAGRRRRRT